MIDIRCVNCDEIFQVEDVAEQAECPVCGQAQELDVDQIVDENDDLQPENLQQEDSISAKQEGEETPVPDSKEAMIQEAETYLREGNYKAALEKYYEIVGSMTNRKSDYQTLWGMGLCEAYEQLKIMQQAKLSDEGSFRKQFETISSEPKLKQAMELAPEEVQDRLVREYEAFHRDYQTVYREILREVKEKRLCSKIEALLSANISTLEKMKQLETLGTLEPDFAQQCEASIATLRETYRKNVKITELNSLMALLEAQTILAGDSKMEEALQLRRDMLLEREKAEIKNCYHRVCDNLNAGGMYTRGMKVDFAKLLPNRATEELLFWNQGMADMALLYEKYDAQNRISQETPFQMTLSGSGILERYKVNCMQYDREPQPIDAEAKLLAEWGAKRWENQTAAGESTLTQRDFEKEYQERPWGRTIVIEFGKWLGICAIIQICVGILAELLMKFSKTLAGMLLATSALAYLIVTVYFIWANIGNLRLLTMSKADYIAMREREVGKVRRTTGRNPVYYTDEDGRIHVKSVS